MGLIITEDKEVLHEDESVIVVRHKPTGMLEIWWPDAEERMGVLGAGRTVESAISAAEFYERGYNEGRQIGIKDGKRLAQEKIKQALNIIRD
jgi:hypothetical protein